MSAFSKIFTGDLGALSRGFGGVLVFEYDGFLLTGGVAKQSDGKIEIEVQHSSSAVELTAAVGEVVAGLKNSGRNRLPKHAVLVSAGMVSAMVDLPVDPKNPRKDNEMQELVKWELEPLFTQQNDIWMIGAVLLGRGYITREQRQEVAVSLELATSASGGRRLTRFGELAVEMGVVSRQQLDECLLLQERLVMMDEDVECGWQAQIIQDPDGGERSAWFCTAIGKGTRQKWARAFRNNKIILDWIYPANASSVTGVAVVGKQEGEKVIVEVHQEQILSLRLNNQYLVAVETHKRPELDMTADVCADVCHEQMRPGVGVVYLVGASPELASGLSTRLGREVISLSDKSLGLKGAFAHLTGGVANPLGVRVKAQDPAPPLYKNGDFIRIALIAFLVSTIVTSEILIRLEIQKRQEELVRLDKEFSEKKKLSEQMQQLNTETESVEKQVVTKQEKIAEVTKKLSVINDILIRRQNLVPGLLVALRDSISEEVVLDALVEDRAETNHFALVGWAMTDTAGQLFINNLNQNLSRWGLRIVNEAVIRQTNAYGVDGYSVTLEVIPKPPEELDDSGFTRQGRT